MAALLIGYARCSTDQQDLTAQRDALIGLGARQQAHLVSLIAAGQQLLSLLGHQPQA